IPDRIRSDPIFGKPHVSVGPGRDALRHQVCTDRERLDRSTRADVAHEARVLWTVGFCEPQVPIGAAGNSVGSVLAAGPKRRRISYRVFADARTPAEECEHADIVRRVFGKPDIPVRSRHDTVWGTGRGRGGEVTACVRRTRRNHSNLVDTGFGKPQVLAFSGCASSIDSGVLGCSQRRAPNLQLGNDAVEHRGTIQNSYNLEWVDSRPRYRQCRCGLSVQYSVDPEIDTGGV